MHYSQSTTNKFKVEVDVNLKDDRSMCSFDADNNLLDWIGTQFATNLIKVENI
jgi:hypothetical protein